MLWVMMVMKKKPKRGSPRQLLWLGKGATAGYSPRGRRKIRRRIPSVAAAIFGFVLGGGLILFKRLRRRDGLDPNDDASSLRVTPTS